MFGHIRWKIIYDNLQAMKINEEWLINQLKTNGIKMLKKLCMAVNKQKQIYMINIKIMQMAEKKHLFKGVLLYSTINRDL